MASSSSSSSSRIKRYHVFPSFHGPDVRRGFLSHLHNLFARKGITTFKDQKIERGQTIGPELVQAIRESRISVVLLSKNYASSSWCLDELVEILKCEADSKQTIMTIFYDVDPSDVRKQRGDFGSVFEKTCEGKTEEVKQRWIQALAYVATIAGEHSINWVDEAAMAEKFVTDVSNKLNVTILAKDFDGMVGLQAHLRKVNTLLCLESDEVKMIGIWGPAGIGKSTIARALHILLSSEFRLSCFMGNLSGSFKSIMGVDDYDSKLCLQSQLLSRILNQGDIRVSHLGAIKEWLHDQRVLIILDDVDDLEKLETLASELSWFGDGSRIIVTTEDKQILKAHGINDIYHVGFPSDKEALEILCLAAFKQTCVQDGFEEIAKKVAKLCGNLPLALRVVGSSLRGESKHEWELQLSRIETSLDRKVEDVLRLGYDRLSKKNQSLFLHIACIFFNYSLVNDVTTMLADSKLDVENGIKTLAAKSLVEIDHTDLPHMHSLLQKLGRQVVHEQSDEPGKRQFLVEAEEIRDVLANETGTGSIKGISFDMSKINSEFSISGRTFEGMRNLRFLRIYGTYRSALHISEDMEYLARLRLLEWDSYPRKSLPPKFQTECLVELRMRDSNLEKLWEGIKPLPNLRIIDLSGSDMLKEIPNLSNATNLETLTLFGCKSLVELPSSIRNLHKLEKLEMCHCRKLQVIPTNINLVSLEEVDMSGCSRLRTFPDISSNIKHLNVKNTKIEDVPASVVGRWSRLDKLFIGSRSLKRLTHVPECVTWLDLSNSDIKRIPDCVIGLPFLVTLIIRNCRKLVSLQSLPPSLWNLNASDCGSLKSVSFSIYEQRADITLYDRNCAKFLTPGVMFSNCFSLDEEARRVIIQRWLYKIVHLPGKEIPAEFTHKAKGNSITISSGTFSPSSRFKACFLLSATLLMGYDIIVCRLRNRGALINELKFSIFCLTSSTEQHLFVVSGDMLKKNSCLEVDATTSEIQFEFSCKGKDDLILGCGVQILEEEVEGSSRERKEHSKGAVQVSKDSSVVKSSKHTSWWNWLRKLGLRKKKMEQILEEEEKEEHLLSQRERDRERAQTRTPKQRLSSCP